MYFYIHIQYSYMWTLWCIAQEKKITGLGLTGGYNYRTGERVFIPFILYVLCGVDILLLQALNSGEQRRHCWRSLSASLFALFWR